MEWFWETLGINSTTNIVEIKKAYINEVRLLKNKETKEEVPQAAYDKLAEAEKAAITFIEEQRNQTAPVGYQSSFREQQEELIKVEQKCVSSTKQKETNSTPEHLGIQAKEMVEVYKKTEPEVEPVKLAADSQRHWEEVEKPGKKRNQGLQQKRRGEAKKELTQAKTVVSLKEAVTKQETSFSEEMKVEKVEAVSQVVSRVTEKSAIPSRVLADISDLLMDWPRKILIKEWEKYFQSRSHWSNDEYAEILENFLPLLKGQLSYLPKDVLWYLYEELDLEIFVRTADFNWFRAIDDLPDFSFTQAFYMPEEEAADYFDRRLHLYHAIRQDDWRSRVFEIDELLTYFYSKEDWKSDHQITDQDVENLAAIYQIKQGIERLVHDNLPNRAIADYLVPPSVALDQVGNQTAKFLRIVFTSLKTKTISLEDSLFIENPQTNYLESNLRELLVGLVFYRSHNQVKATKHFKKITNEYQGLVKELPNPVGFKSSTAKPVPLVPVIKTRNFDWRKIIRVLVIGAIGLSILGTFFPKEDANVYDIDDDSGYENDNSEYYDDYSDYWGNEIESPGYGFLAYYVEKSDQYDNIDTQRELYVDRWVSPDLIDIFSEHFYDTDPDEEYNYDIIYKDIDDSTAHYLIIRDETPYLIVEVTNFDRVTAVVGEGWQEVEQKTFDELLNSTKLTTKELLDNVVVGYFSLPANEREEEFYHTIDYFTDNAHYKLSNDRNIADELDFEKATYQMSHTRDGKQSLLLRDSNDQLSLVLILDDYGRINEIVVASYNDYPTADLEYLEEQADEKQSLP